MARVLSQRAWLLLMVCFFGSLPAAVQGADSSHWLVAEELLDSAGLSMVWQTTLPVKKAERLETMVLQGDRLYVRSAQNYTWSLNRDSGQVVFSRSIAPEGFPIFGWESYEDRLITVIDNQLVEIDRDRGKRVRVSDLEISILAPPVRNSELFYVSGTDRRLHAYSAESLVSSFKVAADNESQITSVLAGEDMVVFGTDKGNVVAIESDAPKKLWQFDARGPVAGAVVRDGSSFYFANKDTNVYRLDAGGVGGIDLAWKYQTEAILDRSPQVTAGAVYQYAPGRGVAAINKESGKALWMLPEGVSLLTETAGRAYVITKHNTLVVMHNGTGKKLHWVNFAPVAKYASNATDGRIYIAGNDGRVVCLKPVP